VGASAYEGMLLAALLVLVGFVLLPAVTPAAKVAAIPAGRPLGAAKPLYLMSPAGRHLSAAVMFAVCGVYCSWLWGGGRRTLPMRTWRLGLRTVAGQPVRVPTAALRYVACWAGPALAIGGYTAVQALGYGRWALVPLVFNYAWALVDRDCQFFQDRVAGTRLVVDPDPAP
jgi:RDD family protein